MTVEREVSISVGERRLPAAVMLPEGEGPWPGVVVIHEALGLNDDIRRIARRFAESRYAAVAPDMFAGLGPMPICIMRTFAEYRKGGGRALEALERTRSWLVEQTEVDGSRIGVAGFCMGGGFALLMGTHSPVGVVATYYGDVPREAEELKGVCPVVAGYGERDAAFTRRGRRLERYLEELGVEHDVKFYPDAGHSFMSRHSGIMGAVGKLPPLRVEYNEGAAEDSWSRMLAFFEKHLGAEE
jgi:carboxymethylenebutenolidase